MQMNGRGSGVTHGRRHHDLALMIDGQARAGLTLLPALLEDREELSSSCCQTKVSILAAQSSREAADGDLPRRAE